MPPLHRRPLVVVAAAFTAITTASCGAVESGTNASGNTEGGERTVKLAGVIANATDPFWTTVMCGGTKEAERLGVELEWFSSSTTSAQSMSQNFSSALLTEPDGVYLNPFQASQFSAQVKTLMGDGVPVISSVPLEPPTQYDVTAVATSGDNFVDQFLETMSPGPGSIVALGGIPGIPVLEEEWQPLYDAVRENRPDIEVLEAQYTDFDVTKTTNIVNGLLLRHPDLKMIIASTGPEGQGAAAAVKQADKAGDVQIWAYDAVPAEVQALREGVITVLAAKPAEQMGAYAVQELVDQIESHPDGEPVTPKTGEPEELPLTIITAENVDDPEIQGALYKTECDA